MTGEVENRFTSGSKTQNSIINVDIEIIAVWSAEGKQVERTNDC
jgi:hypothetical protein